MQPALTLWHKHITKFLRNPEAAFGMLLQPFLWVLLFGVGMQAVISQGESSPGQALAPGSETFGGSYIAFVIPGIIVFSALGGAVAGGASLLDDRLRGIIKEYLVAPIPTYSILAGSALSTTTRGLVQALIIALLGLLLGSGILLNPAQWLAALLFVALYSIGISGLALAVAAKVNSSLGYHGLIALDLPLLFASSALYPLAVLPGWMRWIARLNPTTYVIDSIRRLMYGIEYAGQTDIWLGWAVVTGFAIAGMALAAFAFQSEVKRQDGQI